MSRDPSLLWRFARASPDLFVLAAVVASIVVSVLLGLLTMGLFWGVALITGFDLTSGWRFAIASSSSVALGIVSVLSLVGAADDFKKRVDR